MLLTMRNFTKGYVRLAVTGFNAERFINMAAYRGVYIWDVARTEAGVELNVSIKGFRLLKGCAQKTKCRTRIVGKNGLPFIIHRYRKRKVLAGGILFFIAGLILLSSFVWRIEIEGNDLVENDTLLAFLENKAATPLCFPTVEIAEQFPSI